MCVGGSCDCNFVAQHAPQLLRRVSHPCCAILRLNGGIQYVIRPVCIALRWVIYLFDCAVLTVFFTVGSSRGSSSCSSFQVAQRLKKLLLFLKVWDPMSLEAIAGSKSPIAREALVQFPDGLLDPSIVSKLSQAFGFPENDIEPEVMHRDD